MREKHNVELILNNILCTLISYILEHFPDPKNDEDMNVCEVIMLSFMCHNKNKSFHSYSIPYLS